MTRAAAIYDFTIGAGGASVILAEGSYYRIMSSTGALEVRRDGGSGLGPLKAGQGERAEFKRLQLIDKSGGVNTGFILVADDTFIDDRITGEVTVIDANSITTRANRAFSLNDLQVAVAGQFSYVQVFNGSVDKNVYVRSMSVHSPSAQGIAYGFRNSALAVAGAFLNSKRAGGAVSASSLRTEANAVDLLTTRLGRFYTGGVLSQFIEFREPVLLEPGWGFMARPSNVNVQIEAQFEIVEEVL